jgi:hypothetical protein
MRPLIENEDDYEMILVEVLVFAMMQGKSLDDFLLELTEKWNEYRNVIQR